MTVIILEEGHMKGTILMIDQAMIDHHTIVAVEEVAIGRMTGPTVLEGMTEEDTLHVEIGEAMIEDEVDTTEDTQEVMIGEEEAAMIEAIVDTQEDINQEEIEVIPEAMLLEEKEDTQEAMIVDTVEGVMNPEGVVDTEAVVDMKEAPGIMLQEEVEIIGLGSTQAQVIQVIGHVMKTEDLVVTQEGATPEEVDIGPEMMTEEHTLQGETIHLIVMRVGVHRLGLRQVAHQVDIEVVRQLIDTGTWIVYKVLINTC